MKKAGKSKTVHPDDSPDLPVYLSGGTGSVCLKVHVQPKASRTGLAGMYGDVPKLRVHAPPADGAANRECALFLSKIFKVPRSAVTLKSGGASREKTFRIEGVSAPAVRKILEKLLP